MLERQNRPRVESFLPASVRVRSPTRSDRTRSEIADMDMDERATAWVLGVLQGQPEPPRRVPRKEIARLVFRLPYVALFLLALSALMLIVIFSDDSRANRDFVVVLIPASGVVLFLAASIAAYRRVRRAVEHGALFAAEIVRLKQKYRPWMRPPVEAYGQVVVWDDGTELRAGFWSVQAWARRLTEGMAMEALVDRERAKVLLILPPRNLRPPVRQ